MCSLPESDARRAHLHLLPLGGPEPWAPETPLVTGPSGGLAQPPHGASTLGHVGAGMGGAHNRLLGWGRGREKKQREQLRSGPRPPQRPQTTPDTTHCAQGRGLGPFEQTRQGNGLRPVDKFTTGGREARSEQTGGVRVGNGQ